MQQKIEIMRFEQGTLCEKNRIMRKLCANGNKKLFFVFFK